MDTEPRCDRCKHWGDDRETPSWEPEEISFKLCLAVRERWRIQDEAAEKSLTFDEDEARSDKWIAARREALRAARAFVEDGSEYKALLWTGPDFYCALFDAAEG